LKLAAYLRVSTEEQAHSGLGLDAQREQVTRAATLHGHTIQSFEVDAGLSGKTLDRPALQRALSALTTGTAQGIIVASLDRLSRKQLDLLTLIQQFDDRRQTFIAVKEQVDSSTHTGRLILGIFSSIAEWERDNIRDRTRAALAQKRARGEVTGGHPPYGMRREGGYYVPDMKEALLLSRVAELNQAGLTLRQIAAKLTAEGFKTRAGKTTWSHVQVWKILKRAK